MKVASLAIVACLLLTACARRAEPNKDYTVVCYAGSVVVYDDRVRLAPEVWPDGLTRVHLQDGTLNNITVPCVVREHLTAYPVSR